MAHAYECAIMDAMDAGEPDCVPWEINYVGGGSPHVLNQCLKIVNPGYKKRKTLSYGKFSANHESGFRKIPTLGRFRVLFKAVFFGGRNRRIGP